MDVRINNRPIYSSYLTNYKRKKDIGSNGSSTNHRKRLNLQTKVKAYHIDNTDMIEYNGEETHGVVSSEMISTPAPARIVQTQVIEPQIAKQDQCRKPRSVYLNSLRDISKKKDTIDMDSTNHRGLRKGYPEVKNISLQGLRDEVKGLSCLSTELKYQVDVSYQLNIMLIRKLSALSSKLPQN